MGFDVYGRAARSEKGEYFRNTSRWWHPLADYVVDQVDIPESDRVEWHMNGGYAVSGESARRIAARLHSLISTGHVAEFARAEEKPLADERCAVCDGSGHTGRGKCVFCKGRGRVRVWVWNHPFSVQNVAEFAAFSRDSGGFEIR